MSPGSPRSLLMVLRARSQDLIARVEASRLALALPLALAFAYVVVRGTWAQGAVDIDTRYFFIAGKVWCGGDSPYEFTLYEQVWNRFFNDAIEPGVFAYLPGAISYALPIGCVDWPVAKLLFRVLNLAAVALLAGLCLHLVRRRSGHPIGLRELGWLSLGVVGGAVPATVLTGQSSLVVCAAALACAVLARAPPRAWPLLCIALVVAGSKPQLAGPMVAAWFLCDRAARRPLALGAVVAALFCLSVLALDEAPVANLLAALSSNASLGANVASRMIGLGPLLEWLGASPAVARGAGVVALVAALIAVARAPAERTPLALMVAFLLPGLAYPLHDYDGVVLLPVCAFAALLPTRRQLLLAAPLVLLTRPGLVRAALGGLGESAANVAVSAVLLGVLGTLLWWCHRAAPLAQAAPADGQPAGPA